MVIRFLLFDEPVDSLEKASSVVGKFGGVAGVLAGVIIWTNQHKETRSNGWRQQCVPASLKVLLTLRWPFWRWFTVASLRNTLRAVFWRRGRKMRNKLEINHYSRSGVIVTPESAGPTGVINAFIQSYLKLPMGCLQQLFCLLSSTSSGQNKLLDYQVGGLAIKS